MLDDRGGREADRLDLGVVLLDDQPKTAGEGDLIRQNRNEFRVTFGHEIVKDADPSLVQDGLELDMNAAAGEMRAKIRVDQGDVVEFLIKNEVPNIADPAQSLEIRGLGNGRMLIDIIPMAIEMKRSV